MPNPQKARREIAANTEMMKGVCKECKKEVAKLKDYNGHGHFVCVPCFESLSRYFDEEYR